MTAIFLDRDGVINENRADHVKSWAEFRFLPGAVDAVVRLSRAGLRVFVITNQAIVNRGLVPKATVDAVNEAMVRQIRARGGRIEAVAYCPHRPDEGCPCRKPRPGLIEGLAQRHAVDLSGSVVVGDALADVDAAQAAGCQAILVLTGRGREQLDLARQAGRNGFQVANDLAAATELLLGQRTALATSSRMRVAVPA